MTREKIKELDTLFSQLIRSKGRCEWCGRTGVDFQCSHKIPKGMGGACLTLRWDIMNGMCLCGHCHKWRWHDNPLTAWEWLSQAYPGRYAYLMEAKNRIIKRTDEDYEDIKQAIITKDLRALVTFPDLLTEEP